MQVATEIMKYREVQTTETIITVLCLPQCSALPTCLIKATDLLMTHGCQSYSTKKRMVYTSASVQQTWLVCTSLLIVVTNSLE